ncbi:acyltransferase domain-containing protein [Streptomyces sp. NPDC059063]|uniref:acyltransferase domain-containing protein n=1 Tax=unclassified Streptomyces TaxID=2593676 RepID=UPI0036ABDADB
MGERQLVLLLPGQGAQYQGMAVPLYEREPVFTAVMDEFFAHMGGEGRTLRDDWLAEVPKVPIDDGPRAQPLLFAVGYAIGRVLESRGIRPALLLGHSVGELAAAALAGVYDLAAAARIMRARSEVLDDAPPGGLLAVAAAPDALTPLLDPSWTERGLAVGAVNAPAQTILAGAERELALAERFLRDSGLTCRRVKALQPFHSPVLDPAAAVFAKAIGAENLSAPRIPVMSARTASTVEPGDALDPAFWAGLMSGPVLFWSALMALPADGTFLFADAGPRSLSVVARHHPSVREGRSEVCALLPARNRDVWSVWQAGLERLAEDAGPRERSRG